MSSMTEDDWEVLVNNIWKGTCTPLVGTGACQRVLKFRKDIAEKWAGDHHFPLKYRELSSVAQFRVIKAHESTTIKEKLLEEFNRELESFDFENSNEIHHILAELPLPIYITTSYDDFMKRALSKSPRPGKAPIEESCHWNKPKDKSFSQSLPLEFTENKPLVYYLFGHNKDKESLIITEDEYLDFIVKISEDRPEMLRAYTKTNYAIFIYAASANFTGSHNRLSIKRIDAI